MTHKQRETIQKVVGILWALSYGEGQAAEPVTDAMDLLDKLLNDDCPPENAQTK